MKKVVFLVATLPLLLAGCSELKSTTGIRGQVLETVTQDPIPNVEISIGSDEIGWTSVLSDADGWYEVVGFNLASTRMRLNGRPASVPGHRYPSVQTQLHDDWIQTGEIVTLEKPKWLPLIDESTRVDLSSVLIPPDSKAGPGPRAAAGNHPASDGWLQIDPSAAPVHVENDHVMVTDPSDPTGPKIATFIYYDFQPGTYLKFPEGEETAISVTQIPVDQLPHDLPPYVNPETMVASHPGGTFIDPPVQLHFGSGFLSETYDSKEAWSLSHSLALFLNVGELVNETSDRGLEYVSKPGEGLRELGWHGAAPPPPCNNINFYATIIRLEDGTEFVPDDETVVMSVSGRGFLNKGSRLESGFSGNVGCQANVQIQYRATVGPVWKSSFQMFLSRGAESSEFCIGTYIIDVKNQAVIRDRDSC